MQWLDENWPNMLDTVVTLATNAGQDNAAQNTVGTISKAEANEYFKVLSEKALLSMNPADCKTQWENKDDEKYPFDVQPYPTKK